MATARLSPHVAVLTVPHAACPDLPRYHECDFAATRMARLLRLALQKKNVEVSLHEAEVPRAAVDMNRPVGRGTAWRKTVMDVATAAAARATTVVLDVHSFPPDTPGAMGGSTLSVMTLGAPKQWQLSLIASLQQAAGPRLRVVHVEGSLLNDIMLTATERGVPSVLLEFREGLALSDAALLCLKIAEFVAAM
jgi:hypothetical protein